MKLLYSVLFLSIFLRISGFGQVITTQPVFPTADAEVTLIFDLKQAKDSRATGLLGKLNDVYLWSGAGSTATGDAVMPFSFNRPGKLTFQFHLHRAR